jgi:hypothetical protein
VDKFRHGTSAALLTDIEVVRVRIMYAHGWSPAEVVRSLRFKASRAVVWGVIRGRTYKHLPMLVHTLALK